MERGVRRVRGGWRGDVYMCVRVCPAGVWGVDIHSLCHRTFIERLLHICPVLSTGANEKWCLGRGKTRGGGGPVGRGVAGRRPGWCWEVWLQGECEHPRHTAGWRLPGATRQPCRKRWAVCILRLRKPRPEESESPPRVTQAAGGGGGTEPRPPDRGAPVVPSLPSLPLSPSLRLHCSVLLFWDALGTSACETP